MVTLIIAFQILRLFCVAYGILCREKLYPSGSSDLVLHSSINRCVVNLFILLKNRKKWNFGTDLQPFDSGNIDYRGNIATFTVKLWLVLSLESD